MPARDLAVLVGDERSWAHQAHLATENVDQLGRLVEAGAPQHPPDPRNPGVVADLEQTVALVEGLQLPSQPVGSRMHCAELEHHEFAAVTTDPPLLEQGRPLRIEPDGDRGEKEQWAECDDQQRRPDDVETALYELRGAREAELASAEQCDPVDLVTSRRRADHFEEAWQHARLNTE